MISTGTTFWERKLQETDIRSKIEKLKKWMISTGTMFLKKEKNQFINVCLQESRVLEQNGVNCDRED